MCRVQTALSNKLTSSLKETSSTKDVSSEYAASLGEIWFCSYYDNTLKVSLIVLLLQSDLSKIHFNESLSGEKYYTISVTLNLSLIYPENPKSL